MALIISEFTFSLHSPLC